MTEGVAPRVWSLVVTIFGDLAQAPDAELSGAALGRLAGAMGVRPEAVRVALHRLRKDGWLESRRTRGGSAYRLTEAGRRESAQASPRIYADAAQAGRAWLVLRDPGSAAAAGEMPGVTWLGASMGLAAREVCGADLYVNEVPRDAPLPGWIRTRVCDAAAVRAARDLAARLGALQAGLAGAAPGPAQRVALRVLVVHGWRRVVLRVPMLPDHVFPDGWAGPECRRRVAGLLAVLDTPDITALEAEALAG
jgi:phenylacetic acid degradation operon negative regulatory protein